MAYATIQQANAYVQSYYGSTDNIRISWEALTDQDKQVMLNRAELLIDQLALKGRPTEEALRDNKAFPRYPDKDLSIRQASIATIELSVQLNGNTEAKEALEIRRRGVKSYKIGDLSETFEGSNFSEAELEFVLGIVGSYLRLWLGGGFRICPTRCKR